jgi:RNA polymerase primary sigma factor
VTGAPFRPNPALSRLFRELAPFSPLSREREAELGGRPDAKARNELVCSNLAFVVRVAREYRQREVPFEDLVHEGGLGLIEAARRFDPGKGVKFLTYARWWVQREILRALREQGSLIQIPDHRRRQLRRIRGEREDCESRAGRKLAWEEFCEVSSRSPADVARLREADPVELRLDHGTSEQRAALVERLPDPRGVSVEERMIREELCERLATALARLPGKQRRVLAGRFGLAGGPALTLQEVGLREGVSRERARQIERDALTRLSRLIRHPAAGQPRPTPDLHSPVRRPTHGGGLLNGPRAEPSTSGPASAGIVPPGHCLQNSARHGGRPPEAGPDLSPRADVRATPSGHHL